MRRAWLALLLFLVCARPALADEISSQLVVCRKPGAPGLRAATDASPLMDPWLRPLRRLGASNSPPATAQAQLPDRIDPARVWLVEAADSAAAEQSLRRLRADPRVEWVERNQLRVPQVWRLADPATAGARGQAPSDPGFPDDPLFRAGRQWGLAQSVFLPGTPDIGALAAWRVSVGSNRVVLAIADTGIDPFHPDLAGTLPDGSARLFAPLDVVAGGALDDRYGHGTLVAGIAAARTNDGAHFDSLGIAGVCGGDGRANDGCRIMPIKVTAGAAGDASSFDLAAAVLHAAALGARAVNLSFAGDLPSTVERLALLEAVTHGCMPVVSAGNRGARGGGDQPQYPAAYSVDGCAIQVGASDSFDRRAAFSSHGPGLDLLAPGVEIWTTYMTYPSAAGGVHPGYVAGSGTSFAAPFVTGAVGLLAAARPELVADDFRQVIDRTAHDLETPGADAETGAGRLDLARALSAVGPGIGIWHDEVAAQEEIEVGSDTLVVSAGGWGVPFAGRAWATCVLARARVTLPDSFAGPVQVWPRLAGTTTTRGGFRLPYFTPWAAVSALDSHGFTIEGFLYRTSAGAVPFPEDEIRFGFTVLGPLHARAAATLKAPLPALRAAPNPFRGTTRIVGGPGTLEIYDVSGRRVRRATLDASFGAFAWNGADDRGAPLAPGVYLARVRAAGATRWLRLLKVE